MKIPFNVKYKQQLKVIKCFFPYTKENSCIMDHSKRVHAAVNRSSITFSIPPAAIFDELDRRRTSTTTLTELTPRRLAIFINTVSLDLFRSLNRDRSEQQTSHMFREVIRNGQYLHPRSRITESDFNTTELDSRLTIEDPARDKILQQLMDYT